ncbi:MAG TPA: sugar-binding domain-containing protein [Chthoniobacterales bacterium]
MARLYHEEGLTQHEIATQLRCSQGAVCRFLQRAVDQGIVRTAVIPPAGTFVDLEELLEQKFGLGQAVIARAAHDSEENVQHAVGTAAAHFLETILRPREVIGVDAGSATLRSMVQQMRPVWKVADCEVIQVLGGTGDVAAANDACCLLRQLATLVQGKARLLPAPAVMASPQAANLLAEDPHLGETMAQFERITVALVGVGTAEASAWCAGGGGLLSTEAVQTLQARGAVGHVCLRYYDRHGQELKDLPGAAVFGLEAARLKRVPRVVGIAGGKRKHQALLGALRGRWVNVLVTDQFSAEALLRA